MNTTTDQLLRNELEVLSENSTGIEKAVANEALDHEDPEDFFRQLQRHGCVGGVVSSLIYYVDTHRFFDSHYDEIEELRIEYEDMTGCSLKINGDLKNYLAWFAFEEKAFLLWNELEDKLERVL